MQDQASELHDNLVTQTKVILNDYNCCVYLRKTRLDMVIRAKVKCEAKLQTPTLAHICRYVNKIPPF